mmetsp:Transcript_22333/g.44583  ORF Transcript_22333/g.44583 Transcript_22333/m.44583 type:complete len:212 (-) Transcript_22333:961-1596(-)
MLPVMSKFRTSLSPLLSFSLIPPNNQSISTFHLSSSKASLPLSPPSAQHSTADRSLLESLSWTVRSLRPTTVISFKKLGNGPGASPEVCAKGTGSPNLAQYQTKFQYTSPSSSFLSTSRVSMCSPSLIRSLSSFDLTMTEAMNLFWPDSFSTTATLLPADQSLGESWLLKPDKFPTPTPLNPSMAAGPAQFKPGLLPGLCLPFPGARWWTL